MTPLRFGSADRDLPGDRALVLAVVDPDVAAVETALAEGADLLDLGVAGPDLIAEVRARHPRLVLAATPGDMYAQCEAGVDLLDGTGGDTEIPETAAQYGVGLIAPTAKAADWSQWLQVPAAGVLLDCPPGPDLLRRLDQPTAWPRLITLPDNGFGDEALALAALAAWRGVRVFRSREVPRVRQALEMAASIHGSRPPAAVLRALT
ncbi:pterin-binding domain-containing protein [Crossiella cryophila]|uniref:Dihydropteroate synthase n=1 Tax=Crossiella cryophila TaxID=43355 RepID=A0A7W7FSR0_9PSEU|nr:hypothetical protein [Crossiella cryophila]MBB4674019.1 dihydropteroate synthase [Crossiella cryophila]